mmetsp:Transcript_39803/g.125034  ORF Transcript_39803/g.125034 Transcript_39803/m.125034 type:complete len:420 (+) Transcript_39803:574-1833(+)
MVLEDLGHEPLRRSCDGEEASGGDPVRGILWDDCVRRRGPLVAAPAVLELYPHPASPSSRIARRRAGCPALRLPHVARVALVSPPAAPGDVAAAEEGVTKVQGCAGSSQWAAAHLLRRRREGGGGGVRAFGGHHRPPEEFLHAVDHLSAHCDLEPNAAPLLRTSSIEGVEGVGEPGGGDWLPAVHRERRVRVQEAAEPLESVCVLAPRPPRSHAGRGRASDQLERVAAGLSRCLLSKLEPVRSRPGCPLDKPDIPSIRQPLAAGHWPCSSAEEGSEEGDLVVCASEGSDSSSGGSTGSSRQCDREESEENHRQHGCRQAPPHGPDDVLLLARILQSDVSCRLPRRGGTFSSPTRLDGEELSCYLRANVPRGSRLLVVDLHSIHKGHGNACDCLLGELAYDPEVSLEACWRILHEKVTCK